MVDIKQLNSKEEYDNFISEGKHFIKFSAEWCGPCRVLEGVITKLDTNKLNGVTFGEINVDDDFADEITKSLSVRNIPTTILFENGVEKSRIVGMSQANEFYKKIEE